MKNIFRFSRVCVTFTGQRRTVPIDELSAPCCLVKTEEREYVVEFILKFSSI